LWVIESTTGRLLKASTDAYREVATQDFDSGQTYVSTELG